MIRILQTEISRLTESLLVMSAALSSNSQGALTVVAVRIVISSSAREIGCKKFFMGSFVAFAKTSGHSHRSQVAGVFMDLPFFCIEPTKKVFFDSLAGGQVIHALK